MCGNMNGDMSNDVNGDMDGDLNNDMNYGYCLKSLNRKFHLPN